MIGDSAPWVFRFDGGPVQTTITLYGALGSRKTSIRCELICLAKPSNPIGQSAVIASFRT
jgi:hypothetical protein